MRKRNSILSILLCAVLVLGLFPVNAGAEDTVADKTKVSWPDNMPTSGSCGANVTWSFDVEMGTLTISGEGDITQTPTSQIPGYGLVFSDLVENIVIENGVTSIGDWIFTNFSKLTSVVLPDSLTSIGSYAFYMCHNLTDITISNNVNSIMFGAFAACSGLKEIHFAGNAPDIYTDVFSGVTAAAYYPSDNATWTADVMRDYGGTITWVPTGDSMEEPAHDNALGDPNHDGKINAKDATLILQKSVGVLKEDAALCEICADVSGDGKLNAKDSTLILQYSVGLRTEFHAQG